MMGSVSDARQHGTKGTGIGRVHHRTPDHHPRRRQALWHLQVYGAYGSNKLGQHRTIVSAAFAQSFAPSVQL